MGSKPLIIATLAVVGTTSLAAAVAGAEMLTVDKAVQIALRANGQVIQAEAGVLDARGGVWGAYAGVLPRLSASVSSFENVVNNQQASRLVFLGDTAFTSKSSGDFESHGTTPSVSGSWNVFNLSSIAGLRSARSGLQAAKHQRTSARQEVAFNARRQFYEVVRAVKLAEVADGALLLSRDNERRVRALFEVGSVSRSDVLKAQVVTAQSELDSLTRHHAVTVQRIVLAALLGLREGEMGEVDTVLIAGTRDYDENALQAEAVRNRPDLMAAEAEMRAARAGVNSARFLRLPYLSLAGSADFNTRSRSTTTLNNVTPETTLPSSSSTDRQYQASVSVNWDLFDGFATDSRIASARARLLRARETRDALRRNLASEVYQALMTYREAVATSGVARRALESATESLKLTQQKYNVGSATILELVDAQVQLQRAQSDEVSALAAIRVGEAQLSRVLGRSE